MRDTYTDQASFLTSFPRLKKKFPNHLLRHKIHADMPLEWCGADDHKGASSREGSGFPRHIEVMFTLCRDRLALE